MTTNNYQTLRAAITAGRSVCLFYKGYWREISPHVLGFKGGSEKVLTYQFGGGSSSGLPMTGEWRCMFVSEISEIRPLNKPWHTGGSHLRPQTCVDQVDVEVRVGGDGKPYIHAA